MMLPGRGRDGMMLLVVEREKTKAKAADPVERLFVEEADNVWRAVLAYSGRREIADEAVAEAFARMIVYGERIRRPVGWLYRVAFRLAAQEMRRERATIVDAPDAAVDPPEVLGVFGALRMLTPNQRAAVVLYHEMDLPAREVAARMGISAATVRVHLHLGRKRLRELLGDEEA